MVIYSSGTLSRVRAFLMPMGVFDEEEHERREKTIYAGDANWDGGRSAFEGDIECTEHDSLDELRDRLDESSQE